MQDIYLIKFSISNAKGTLHEVIATSLEDNITT